MMICALCSQLLMAQTVGPLIETQWDQTAPFNCMIPEKDGQHCLASCGAAAMAQICYYHRWPEHGMGEGDWHFVDGEPVRVDLTQDYYEYDKMLLTYNENSSEEALKATALLIRDVAFLGAVFGLEESMSPSVQGLATCFGYDKGVLHLDRNYCTDEEFKSIIRAELDAGRPVYMSGSNGSMGHSFICDGYRDNDEFHFNYGWAGKSDGWATLENFLFPVSMTIGLRRCLLQTCLTRVSLRMATISTMPRSMCPRVPRNFTPLPTGGNCSARSWRVTTMASLATSTKTAR